MPYYDILHLYMIFFVNVCLFIVCGIFGKRVVGGRLNTFLGHRGELEVILFLYLTNIHANVRYVFDSHVFMLEPGGQARPRFAWSSASSYFFMIFKNNLVGIRIYFVNARLFQRRRAKSSKKKEMRADRRATESTHQSCYFSPQRGGVVGDSPYFSKNRLTPHKFTPTFEKYWSIKYAQKFVYGPIFDIKYNITFFFK